jgi:hypothetical protein
MHRALRRLVGFALAVLLPAVAPAQQAQEHEVKAAFLYKFPAFVEWPAKPGPEVPFVIAVLGAEDVAEELRRLARGRTHDGRAIHVREPGDTQALHGAHMVFVGHAAAARLPLIARSLAGAPVLLVTEWPGALEQGSMINFLLSDGRVRFEVALDKADAGRLRISSRLLAVAVSVRGGRL